MFTLVAVKVVWQAREKQNPFKQNFRIRFYAGHYSSSLRTEFLFD
jgi:hypothetical protein